MERSSPTNGFTVSDIKSGPAKAVINVEDLCDVFRSAVQAFTSFKWLDLGHILTSGLPAEIDEIRTNFFLKNITSYVRWQIYVLRNQKITIL